MGIDQESHSGAADSTGGVVAMRAAVQRSYGPPSLLEVSDVELPLPGRGEVLVRVGAASVHPGDCFVMALPRAAVRRVLTPDGVLIPNSGRGGRWIGPLGRIVTARLLSFFTRQRLKPFLSVEKREDLSALADMLTTAEVRPVIDKTFPLEQAADALRYVAAGHTRGKVVVTM